MSNTKRNGMRTISLRIPDDLDRALTELARRRGEARSAVIRACIEIATRRDGASVGALAADLAGALSGPADLSTSDAHQHGYGE